MSKKQIKLKQCKGKTLQNTRCKNSTNSEYCYHHCPYCPYNQMHGPMCGRRFPQKGQKGQKGG